VSDINPTIRTGNYQIHIRESNSLLREKTRTSVKVRDENPGHFDLYGVNLTLFGFTTTYKCMELA